MSTNAMDRDTDKSVAGDRLFRRTALQTAGHRFLGKTVVVLPPSAGVSLGAALLSLSLLLLAAVVVEIPTRAEAIGVLMPPGGFLDVTAAAPGRVSAVHVEEGQHVGKDQLLIEIDADEMSLAGRTRPELELHSLRNEASLLERLQAERSVLAADRESGLLRSLQAIDERMRLGEHRLSGKVAELGMAEAAHARMGELAARGHIARNALDREQSRILALQGAVDEIRQQQAALRLERERLNAAIRESRRQTELGKTEFALQQERLARDIELVASRTRQGVRAPQTAMLVRLPARAGMTVQRGQVIARLAGQTGPLEAWLYLSNMSARMLAPGQDVELSFDAWPRSVFGSRRAVVDSISPVALLPREVTAPVNVAGPVFEVRAILADDAFQAYGAEWRIPPGTSFRASIIQRRLRLYQWLFESLRAAREQRRA